MGYADFNRMAASTNKQPSETIHERYRYRKWFAAPLHEAGIYCGAPNGRTRNHHLSKG
jgi:hypothetical protein